MVPLCSPDVTGKQLLVPQHGTAWFVHSFDKCLPSGRDCSKLLESQEQTKQSSCPQGAYVVGEKDNKQTNKQTG